MKHSLETTNLSFWAPLTFIDTPDNDLLDFHIYLNSWYQFLPKWKLEVSHILEHCLFEKNRNFATPLDFKYALETLWAGKNGYSSYSTNHYTIQWTKDKYRELISLLLRLVNEPILEEEIFNQQKSVVRNELINASNDTKREMSTKMSCIVRDKLLTFRERVAAMEGITFQEVRSFYNSHYTWANSKFIIAWDVSGIKDGIRSAIENYYREMPIWKKFAIQESVPSDYAWKTLFLEDSNKTNYDIFLRFLVESVDMDVRNKFIFFLNLFMSWLGSRIQFKARQQWLIYSLMSESAGFKEFLQLAFSEWVSEEKIIPLLKLIIDETRDVLAGNVDEKEMERARWYMLWSYLRSFNSWEQLIQFHTDRLILDEEKMDFNEMILKIGEFTKEDLISFSKMLDMKNWMFWVCGKDAQMKSQEVGQFLKDYLKS
ncbi:MAG: Peptidase M16 protein [uncultured bacterium (gcode 4)]|uniref:Peptidase M16 protein n=1 Tax=uncultured bacterium (gcode 4) TaxID=1234023 RepID=K2G3C7_9BACT|nr:MAG: Peptidase M16 protein [uncultured bacterium (gcode 4)]